MCNIHDRFQITSKIDVVFVYALHVYYFTNIDAVVQLSS